MRRKDVLAISHSLKEKVVIVFLSVMTGAMDKIDVMDLQFDIVTIDASFKAIFGALMVLLKTSHQQINNLIIISQEKRE